MSVKIDHVLFAVPDLEDAAARFDSEYGLTSLRGGQHPGHGTANMIIPLGGDYIELIAVVDPVEAATSPFGGLVSAAVDDGGGWIGYALRVSDLAHHLDVGESTIDMSRRRPDGTHLAWSIGRFESFLGPDRHPFLIQWHADPAEFPGAEACRHKVEVTGIAWIEIGGIAWPPQTSHLDIRPVGGPAGLRRIGLRVDEGQLTI